MSRVVVDLTKQPQVNAPEFGDYQKPVKRSKVWRVLGILGGLLLLLAIAGLIGGYFYWQGVKKTPQYSLALLVDAARRDDKDQIDKIVDTEAVATNFIPQITDKAVELYGRNLPQGVISKVAQVVGPLMPGIKGRAREELPKLIREKTQKFENVPYWMIALGAERAIDIKIEGDTAKVISKIPDKPLELKMKRNGDLWQIIEVKDEALAKKIAEKAGQQIIALASKDGLSNAAEKLGIKGLDSIIKDLDGIFK